MASIVEAVPAIYEMSSQNWRTPGRHFAAPAHAQLRPYVMGPVRSHGRLSIIDYRRRCSPVTWCGVPRLELVDPALADRPRYG